MTDFALRFALENGLLKYKPYGCCVSAYLLHLHSAFDWSQAVMRHKTRKVEKKRLF